MKKNNITVGIPAFNEEANIGFLIKSLLNQKKVVLKKIVICSDRSTDQTDQIVTSLQNEKVKLLINKKRSGQSSSQNRIISETNTDILVLLNADILINDKFFLSKITKPISKGLADLTSVSVEELQPENFLERVLTASMKFKKRIFENYNLGNNLYTCHGRARAFSKKLYKKIIFKQSVGEDAYSYLFCIKNKMTYRFVKKTKVYYRLPQTMVDHEKQSVRFYNSQEIFNKEFGTRFVASQNFLTPDLLIKELVKYFFINPLIAVYFLVAVYLKIKSLIVFNSSDLWQSAATSKNLREIK